jgi:lipopolysaccharide biosynthesis glycosyltransferase
MILDSGVHLATATDRGYLPWVAALADSLRHCRRAGQQLTLTVLHTGVEAADKDRMAVAAGGVELRWIEITAELTGSRGPELAALAARPHYFRCLLPDVLPPDQKRVVYLDADTMVDGDLGELWGRDLYGDPVGAVRDPLGTVSAAIGDWRERGLDGDAGYFNSGVLLIDLDAWRAADAGWSAIRHCVTGTEHLTVAGRWEQHDQYGLNVVFHRRWEALEPEWNHPSFRPYRPFKVLHFLSGSGRPGSRYCDPRYAERFHDAVDRTAWRGWRPAEAAVATR